MENIEEKDIPLIKELLISAGKITVKNDTIRDERGKRGEFFNIFDVLKVSSNEVRLHSAFIAELLSPDGSHGLGDKFLVEFLKGIGFEKFSTSTAKVFVEKYIGHIDDDYAEGGRLDIIIESSDGKYAVAIENKIYARDQYNQLLRYKNYLEKKLKLESSNYKLLYLTLHGDDPSKNSIDNAEKPFWENISYESLITKWLSRCVQIAKSHPLIRETLNQYLNLIKELTYQTLEEEMEEELIKLLMEGNNLRYAQQIAYGIDGAKYRIINEKIVPKIKELEKDIKLSVGVSKELGVKDSEFWFTKPLWQAKNLYIGFMFEKDNYAGFHYYVICEKPIDKKLSDKLKNISNNRWRKSNGDGCPYWNEIEGIRYDDTLPIWCFTDINRFVKAIKDSVLKLAEAVDFVIESCKQDSK